MPTWRILRGTYDVLETIGSVPGLHRGPLGSVAKVWDHLDPAFTLDHRFLSGGAGSEIIVWARKIIFFEIRSELVNEWEVVPSDGYWSKLSHTIAKFHLEFRIPPLGTKIEVQKMCSDHWKQPKSRVSVEGPYAALKGISRNAAVKESRSTLILLIWVAKPLQIDCYACLCPFWFVWDSFQWFVVENPCAVISQLGTSIWVRPLKPKIAWWKFVYRI